MPRGERNVVRHSVERERRRSGYHSGNGSDVQPAIVGGLDQEC